jgi:hypothetical protein
MLGCARGTLCEGDVVEFVELLIGTNGGGGHLRQRGVNEFSDCPLTYCGPAPPHEEPSEVLDSPTSPDAAHRFHAL